MCEGFLLIVIVIDITLEVGIDENLADLLKYAVKEGCTTASQVLTKQGGYTALEYGTALWWGDPKKGKKCNKGKKKHVVLVQALC